MNIDLIRHSCFPLSGQDIFRKEGTFFRFGFAFALLLAPFALSAQDLIHRYSFDENANDLAGTAHGALKGGSVISDGAVVLDGEDAYVDLPNGLLSGLTDASVEIWTTWEGWGYDRRIFSFGNSQEGEDTRGTPSSEAYLMPHYNGEGMQFNILAESGTEQRTAAARRLIENELHQIVWTYDAATTTARLYLDGVEVAVNEEMTNTLASLGETTNNWIGRSVRANSTYYGIIPDYKGKVAEFRIYNGPLGSAEVAARYAEGPDPAGRGALNGLTLANSDTLYVGTSEPVRLLGDFERLADLNISAEDVTFAVGNPAVLSVSPERALVAGTAPGTTTVTATYGGQSATLEVAVKEPLLRHRYSFESLTEEGKLEDLASGADADLTSGDIENGALAAGGVATLPASVFSGLTDSTIEMWFENPSTNWWGGLFGATQTSPTRLGTNDMWMLTEGGWQGLDVWFGNSGGDFGWGDMQLVMSPVVETGRIHHVVWTHQYGSHTGRIYLNGQLVGERRDFTRFLGEFGDEATITVGSAAWGALNGPIYEVKIIEGAVSAEKARAMYAAGPNPDGLGEPLALTFDPSIIRLYEAGSYPVSIRGDFAEITGLDITTHPDLELTLSGDPVLTLTAGNELVATGTPGTAVLTAVFGGKTFTQTITVSTPALAHRYAFDADAGDSVGGAHGTLESGAIIENGAVKLDATANAYVNLPNGLGSGSPDLSLEFWTTWNGGGATQALLDFGQSTGGEDVRGAAVERLLLTPGAAAFSLVSEAGGAARRHSIAALEAGRLTHIVWTWQENTATSVLYINGEPAGTATSLSSLQGPLEGAVNNWLGRSQDVSSPGYNGSITEFRIYHGPLNAATVKQNYLSGPDPAGRGALASIAVGGSTHLAPGLSGSARVTGNFERIAGVDITGEEGVTLASANVAVVAVTETGALTGGTALGSTTITASFDGKTAAYTVHNALPANLARTGAGIIGINNEATLTSLGVANANAGTAANINDGNPASRVDSFSSGAYTHSYVGVVWDAPVPYAITAIELRLALFGDGGWFGRNNDGPGSGGALSQANHLVAPIVQVTTDGGATWTETAAGSNYLDALNGHPIGGGEFPNPNPADVRFEFATPLSGINGIRVIGEEGGTVGGGFIGVFEFALTDIRATQPAERGALQAVALEGITGELPTGASQQAQVLAHYENVHGLDVTAETGTGFAVNPAGPAAVGADGVLYGVAEGGTVLTASYGGQTASQVVGVTRPLNISRGGMGIMGVITDDTRHEPGITIFHGGDQAYLNDGNSSTSVDSWVASGENLSFAGIVWDEPVVYPVTDISLTLALFFDGGWFGKNNAGPGSGGRLSLEEHLVAPGVQITTDGGETWQDVAATTDYMDVLDGHPVGGGAYPNPNAALVRFSLATPANGINGVRVIGEEGGTVGGGFLGVFELEIYDSRALLSSTPAAQPWLITSLIRNANGSLRLAWEARGESGYVLEYSADLQTWTEHEENGAVKIFTDADATTGIEVATPAASTHLFLRVKTAGN